MNDTWGSYLSDLLPGLAQSLQITIGALLIGIPLGIVLAIGLLSKSRAVSIPVLAVVEISRGFPVLVILYLLYFGLPQLDLTLTAFVSAVLGLGLSFGAYTSEVFKAGLAAIPAGQREAAMALGLSRTDAFMRVLLPQALKIVVPPLIGWAIIYFQATSLAYALAVPELMSRAYTLATTNFQYLNMLGLAALFYAAISIPLSLFAEHLGRRSSRSSTKSLDPTTLLK